MIKLTPKAFAVLHYLIEHPGRVVTKEELFTEVWPETVVVKWRCPYAYTSYERAWITIPKRRSTSRPCIDGGFGLLGRLSVAKK
jgi:hypothetical protein